MADILRSAFVGTEASIEYIMTIIQSMDPKTIYFVDQGFMYAVTNISDIGSYQQVTILEHPRTPNDYYLLKCVRNDGYGPTEIALTRRDVVDALVSPSVED